jgi:hypothetical protein
LIRPHSCRFAAFAVFASSRFIEEPQRSRRPPRSRPVFGSPYTWRQKPCAVLGTTKTAKTAKPCGSAAGSAGIETSDTKSFAVLEPFPVLFPVSPLCRSAWKRRGEAGRRGYSGPFPDPSKEMTGRRATAMASCFGVILT